MCHFLISGQHLKPQTVSGCKSLTNFEKSLQFQGSQHWLLLHAPIGLGYALHFHFGALEQLIGPISVLNKATGDFQGHLDTNMVTRKAGQGRQNE